MGELAKWEKLYLRYKERPQKADFILKVDDVLDNCLFKDNFTPLVQLLSVTIEGKASKYAARWKKSRIEFEEFVSVFYEELWRMLKIEMEYINVTDFYFYETFLLALDRRALDLIRKATGPQEEINRKAILKGERDAFDLPQYTSESNNYRLTSPTQLENFSDRDFVWNPKQRPRKKLFLEYERLECEDFIINRLLVNEILNNPDLTGEQRAILDFIYKNPEASLREVATSTGFIHAQQVSREMDKIQEKLKTYGEEEGMINLTKINKVSQKVNARFTDVKALCTDYARLIEEHVTETGERPDSEDLRIMADKLIYVAENIDREKEREHLSKLTRDDWKRLEREYVGEKPKVDAASGKVVCACWNCTTAFKPKRRNSKYCSVACRNEQARAEQRLKEHGTYLPVKEFSNLRADSKEVIWKRKVRLDDEKIQRYPSDGRSFVKTKTRKPSEDKKPKVNVRFARTNEEPSEVVVHHWTHEQIDNYLIEKYGDKYKKMLKNTKTPK